jgi:hypothetical protein
MDVKLLSKHGDVGGEVDTGWTPGGDGAVNVGSDAARRTRRRARTDRREVIGTRAWALKPRGRRGRERGSNAPT